MSCINSWYTDTLVTTTKEIATTQLQPKYFLTSTVHTKSSPKGGPLTTESVVTKSTSTDDHDHNVITEMGSLTSGKNVSHNFKLSLNSVREAVAWTVTAISMVLFVASLTVNITMLWLRYKKRQAKDNNVETPMYEMEGNPCHEAASMKQTTDSTGVQEVHLYESVNQKYN